MSIGSKEIHNKKFALHYAPWQKIFIGIKELEEKNVKKYATKICGSICLAINFSLYCRVK